MFGGTEEVLIEAEISDPREGKILITERRLYRDVLPGSTVSVVYETTGGHRRVVLTVQTGKGGCACERIRDLHGKGDCRGIGYFEAGCDEASQERKVAV